MQQKPSPEIIRLVAVFFLSNKSTVRETANFFGISKSTAHNYLHKYLITVDKDLFKQVKNLLDTNFEVKHIRGGNATKIKYEKQKGGN